MDESPSKAEISIKEEESIEISSVPSVLPWEKNIKNSVPSLDSPVFFFNNCNDIFSSAEKIKEEESIEISSVPLVLPWEKNIKNSVPSLDSPVFVFNNRNDNFASAEKRRADVKFVPTKEFVGTRSQKRDPFSFIRECKKMELLWKNRGLPVDKEILHAAASKDPFDLKDLSDSLPSTSVGRLQGNFSVSNALRRMRSRLQQDPQSYLLEIRQGVERLKAANKSPVSSCTPEGEISLPTSEAGKAEQESLMRCALQKARIWARYKRWIARDPHSKPNKEPDCDEQKEASEEKGNSDLEKVLQNWVRKGPETIRDPNICPEFSGMSLDGQQEEKRKESQSSDAENSQGRVGLAPSPDLSQIMGQCSSWDSGKTWNTDFKAPDLLVPLNSPIKKEKIGYKDLPAKLKEEYYKLNADFQQQKMWLFREERRLKALNRHRGVSEVIGFSEFNARLDQAVKSIPPNHLNSQKVTQDLCLNNLKVCKQMMMHLRESVKTYRSFKSRLSLGNMKSEKVVSD